MQLKTYRARTISEALSQIKADLGSEAVILETREEDGQAFITAALERQPGVAQQSDEAGLSAQQETCGWGNWQEEWKNIKEHLLVLMKPSMQMDVLAPRQKLALEFLGKEGVCDAALFDLFKSMQKDPNLSILNPLNSLVPVLAWEPKNWRQKIHIITGPYGAGKSSVIVRLALHLRQKTPALRICLVNADAFRGNGRLFLRHYAELSDFAYKEAQDGPELTTVLQDIGEKYDLILVDMPGMTRQKRLNEELEKAAINPTQPCFLGGIWRDVAAVHLVLPPQYDACQLPAVLGRYKTLFRTSLIYSKLDEAEQFGQIINIGHLTGLPVSALSFGPQMGNSFTPAGESSLWRLVFKRELPKKVA